MKTKQSGIPRLATIVLVLSVLTVPAVETVDVMPPISEAEYRHILTKLLGHQLSQEQVTWCRSQERIWWLRLTAESMKFDGAGLMKPLYRLGPLENMLETCQRAGLLGPGA